MTRNCAACGHPTEQNNRLGIGTCCTEGESYDPTGARIAGYFDREHEPARDDDGGLL